MKKHSKILITILIFASNVLFIPVVSGNETNIDYNSRAFLSNYIKSDYNSSNGFPADEANAVLQTADGYIWFASYSGLIRYDGEKFLTYAPINGDGFTSTSVRTLFESKDNVLWIGTNDKGLVQYEKGTFTYFDKSNGAPSNTVRAITENSRGVIYCGTAEGIYSLNKQDEINTVALDTEASPFVISIACDSRDNIYGVLNSGEAFVHTTGGETIRLPSDKLFYSIYCTDDDRIIAGGQNTSVVFTSFDGQFNEIRSYDIGFKNINEIYEDNEKRIWIGTDDGTGFFDGENNFIKLSGFIDNGYIDGICQDYEGGYWFASAESGIVKLSKSLFTNENMLNGIDSLNVNAVLKNGLFTYIATNEGLVVLHSQKGLIENDLTALLKETRIRDIYLDSRGQIWILTYAGVGVVCYNENQDSFEIISLADGLVSEKTRRILELKNGYLVLGTASGVNFIKDKRIVSAEEAFKTNSGDVHLPGNMVLSFCETEDGTLYIGTDGNGIYAVKNGKTTIYTEETGLSGQVILQMKEDRKRNGLWVSTGVGLNFIDKDYNVIDMEKLHPYSIFDIIINEDELWLLTTNAILKVNADDLLNDNASAKIEILGKASGLVSSINANTHNYISDENRLFICCNSGISSISLDSIIIDKIPNAAVNKIDIDGEVFQDYDEAIIIPTNAKRLTFDLAFLSYGFSNGAYLSYMLKGQDKTETKVDIANGGLSEVSYTNLASGEYTFVLKSVNDSGQTGNHVEIKLLKEYGVFEYVYVQILIITVAVILVILFGMQIGKNKNRGALKKQHEYKGIISQAISAIANAIDAKDSYTKGHSVRVAAFSAEIARRMGYDKNFIENIYYIGLLHDVGKIGIPSKIINKPEKLTNEETEIMKTHPKLGGEILKDITTIKNILLGVSEHHERWDGKGYNKGKIGLDISIEGRIICCADSYDAMSSDRSYRKALSKELIISEFSRCKGEQFDPDIAKIVIEMVNENAFEVININDIIDL